MNRTTLPRLGAVTVACCAMLSALTGAAALAPGTGERGHRAPVVYVANTNAVPGR